MRDGQRPRRWLVRALAMAGLALLISTASVAAGLSVFGGHAAANDEFLHVSPQGSDSASCTAESPCKSLDRAYHRAAPGQTVRMDGGTYDPQAITADSAKVAAAEDVTITSTPGQLAILN